MVFQMESVATLAGVPNTELFNKINGLEKENSTLKKSIDDLRNLVISLQARVDSLEKGGAKIEASKPKAEALKVSSSIPYPIMYTTNVCLQFLLIHIFISTPYYIEVS